MKFFILHIFFPIIIELVQSGTFPAFELSRSSSPLLQIRCKVISLNKWFEA